MFLVNCSRGLPDVQGIWLGLRCRRPRRAQGQRSVGLPDTPPRGLLGTTTGAPRGGGGRQARGERVS